MSYCDAVLSFDKSDFEVAFEAMRKAQEPPLFAMPTQEQLFIVGFKAMMENKLS
jgi:hypothetical protein